MSEGRLGETTPERELISTTQPLPSPAEWAEARELLLRHQDIGPRLRAGELIAYRPMPPVVTGAGDRRRLVTVGLLPRLPGADGTHEIVGVDITGGPVQRFAARAPARTAAGFGAVCGAPMADDQGASGQFRPNATDGRAKASPDWPFPKGDLWFLRYRAGEIDDGYGSVTGSVEAGLDRFVQNQSINGADVVVWYGAHFTHAQASEEAGGHDHVVGPDLVPVNW